MAQNSCPLALRLGERFDIFRRMASNFGNSDGVANWVRINKSSSFRNKGFDEHELQQQQCSAKPIPKTSFLELCQKRRFDNILAIFERSEEYDIDGWIFPSGTAESGRFDNRSGEFQNGYNLHLFRGESPLHIILHYSPPRAVVSKLIEFLNSSNKALAVPEDAQDMRGQTPLHVAAANGCSVLVIARLLEGVSGVMPAYAKDELGRHALHWACANSHIDSNRFRRESTEIGTVSNMVKVIDLLIKTYPEALHFPDAEGKTPLDLAEAHGANRRVMALLKKCDQRGGLGRSINDNTATVDSTIGTMITVKVLQVETKSLDDEISSVGSRGVSVYGKTQAKLLADTPWKNMTTVDELLQYFERVQNEKLPLLSTC